VVPHPAGPTGHANLVALCRTHHRFKHHAGWKPSLADDGTVTWTAPDHRTWTTHPTPHDMRAELHLLDGLDPGTAHDLRRGWVPGLPPGMSLADLALTEAQLPDDPPETGHTPDPPPDWQTLDWQTLDRQTFDRQAHDESAPECAHDESTPPTSLTSLTSPSALEQHFEHLLALAA
jgi:hypothetical protein